MANSKWNSSSWKKLAKAKDKEHEFRNLYQDTISKNEAVYNASNEGRDVSSDFAQQARLNYETLEKRLNTEKKYLSKTYGKNTYKSMLNAFDTVSQQRANVSLNTYNKLLDKYSYLSNKAKNGQYATDAEIEDYKKALLETKRSLDRNLLKFYSQKDVNDLRKSVNDMMAGSKSLVFAVTPYEQKDKQLAEEQKTANTKRFASGIGAVANAIAASSAASGIPTKSNLEMAQRFGTESQRAAEAMSDASAKYADVQRLRSEIYTNEKIKPLLDTIAKDKELEKLIKNAIKANKEVETYSGTAEAGAALKRQQDAYNAIKAKGYSDEETNNFIDAYTRDQNRIAAETTAGKAAEFAKEHPIIASGLHVGTNILQMQAIPEIIASGAAEWATGEYAPIDINTDAFAATRFRDTTSETVGELLASKRETETGKKVVNFLYQTGLSIGDFLSTAPLGKIAEAIPLFIMGTSAGVQATKDATERGLDATHAMLTGLAAGAAEVVFEKVSLDKLLSIEPDGVMQTIKSLLSQSFTEGSEEFFTDIANAITDQIINGNNSELMQHRDAYIQKYMKQGMSRKEARKKANSDIAKEFGEQLLQSGLGGALSGFVSGGGAVAVNSIAQRSQFNNIGKSLMNKSEDGAALTNAMIRTAEALPSDSAAHKLAGKLRSAKNISNAQIGELAVKTIDAAEEAFSKVDTVDDANKLWTKVSNSFDNVKENDFTSNVSRAYVNRVQQIAYKDYLTSSSNAKPVESVEEGEKVKEGIKAENTERAKSVPTSLNIGAGDTQLVSVIDSNSKDIVFRTANGEEVAYTEIKDTDAIDDKHKAILAEAMGEVRLNSEHSMPMGVQGTETFIKAMDSMSFDNTAELNRASAVLKKAWVNGRAQTATFEQYKADNESDFKGINETAIQAMFEAGAAESTTETKVKDMMRGRNRNEAVQKTSESKGEVTGEADEMLTFLENVISGKTGADIENAGDTAESNENAFHQAARDLMRLYNENAKQDRGEAFALVHEQLERVKAYNPEGYRDVVKSMLDFAIAKTSTTTVARAALNYRATYLSGDALTDIIDAQHEMVNDWCAALICGNETAQQEYAKWLCENNSKSIVQKVLDVINKIVKALNEFLNRENLNAIEKEFAEADAESAKRLVNLITKEMGVANKFASTKAMQEQTENAESETSTDNEVKFSKSVDIGSETDQEYMAAVESGNEREAQELVDEAAMAWGAYSVDGKSPLRLYHGTQSFGFTEFDLDRMDDKRSIFLTSDIDTAQTYSAKSNARSINSSNIDVYKLSYKELAKYLTDNNPNKDYKGTDITYQYLSNEDMKKRIEEAEHLSKTSASEAQNILKGIFANQLSERDKNQLSKIIQDSVYNDLRGVSTALWLLNRDSNIGKLFKFNIKEVEEKIRLGSILRRETEQNPVLSADGVILERSLGGYSYEAMSPYSAQRQAETFAKSGNYSLYAKLDNPFVFDADNTGWRKLRPTREEMDALLTQEEKAALDRMEKYGGDNTEYEDAEYDEALLDLAYNDLFTTRDIAERAYNNGYDGVVFKNMIDMGGAVWDVEPNPADYIIVAFKPENVKSADPVTYDDKGNVIPLSERFSDSKDIRYSRGVDIGTDSEGNTLTEQQQEYFKDSKVRDDNGNLMVMYHGTPNANFTVFRPSYFTANREYADVYQSPSASSISVKQNADNPDTYAVYLNITKPFDTRNKKERDIFYNEFYRKWGNGSELQESGLPDWVEGEDLLEFLEDKGYDYDGLILDEGATGGYGEEVKSRGLSYVTINPEQIKNIDNKAPTDNEDIRYSRRVDIGDESALIKENAKLKEALDYYKMMYKGNSGHIVSRNKIRNIAISLKKTWGSNISTDALAAAIAEMYDYISGGNATWDLIQRRSIDITKSLMEHEIQGEISSDALDVLEELKIREFSLSEAQKSEVVYHYGSMRNWMSRVNRGMKYRKNAPNIDVIWQELSGMYPYIFDEETVAQDMPIALVDITDELFETRTDTIKALDYYSMDELAEMITMDLWDRYFELPEVVTPVDRANKKLNEARIQNRQRLDAVKEADRKKYEKLTQQYENKLGKKQQKISKLEADIRYRIDRNKERNENRRKSALRERILKDINVLSKWLAKPSKEKSVPTQLQKPLLAFLTAINFTNENAKNVDKMTRRWQDVFYRLHGAFSAINNPNNPSAAEEGIQIPQQAIDVLKNLADEYEEENISIYDMSANDLSALKNVVAVIKNTITKSHTLLENERTESLETLGYDTISEISEMKRLVNKDSRLKQLFLFDFADATSVTKMLGEAGGSVVKSLRKAFNKQIALISIAKNATEQILDGVQTKTWSGRNAKLTSFKLENGGEVALTPAQIMDLYLLSKRDQAKEHLLGGGITLSDDIEKVSRRQISKLNKANNKSRQEGYDSIAALATVRKLTVNDIAKITETLTDEQKKVADAIQNFMATTCAAWGNEVTQKLYGYDGYTEADYVPIISTSDFIRSMDSNASDNVSYYAVANQGFTKSTVKNANNPIVVGDLFEVFADHLNNMIMYNAYTIPLSDAMKWINFKTEETSIKNELRMVYGGGAEQWLLNLIKDLNGVKSKAYSDDITGRIISHAKGAKVAFNARVAIQQPTAFLKASLYLPERYMLKAAATSAVKGRQGMQRAKQYCPIALWKSWGFFETNIAPSMSDLLLNRETFIQKLEEFGMKGAELGDAWTWGVLWNACEYYIQDTRSDLEVDSAEYFSAVSEKLEEIIDNTQVVDSPFHRTQIMRSKGTYAKLITAYMAEPMKSYNMLKNATLDMIQSKKGNKGNAVRFALKTAAVYAVTQIAVSAMAALVDGFRRDDDEDKEKTWWERYWERYADAFTGNLLGDNFLNPDAQWWQRYVVSGNLSPLGLLPIVKDWMSAIDGYDASRMDMDVANDFVNIVKTFTNDKSTPYQKAYQTAKAISDLTGLPVSNAVRTFKSVYNIFSSKEKMGKKYSRKDRFAQLVEYKAAGNNKDYNRVYKLLQEDGADEAAINAGIKNALAANDSRIATASEAYKRGDTEAYYSIIREFVSEGFDEDTVHDAIDYYGREPSSETADKASRIYKWDDVYSSLDSGNTEFYDRVYKDAVDTLVANGKTEAEAKDDVYKNLKSHYKKEYSENPSSRNDIERKLKTTGLFTQTDFSEWTAATYTSDALKAEFDKPSSNANTVQRYVQSSIAADVANGTDRKQAESNVKSDITRSYRDAYINGDANTRARIKQYMIWTGLYGNASETAEWLYRYWK